MKKTLIGLAFAASISSSLLAEDLYVGIDGFVSNGDFDYSVSGASIGNFSESYDGKGFKLKFGSLLDYNLRLQGYYQNESMDNSDNSDNEVGFDLIKAFEVTSAFYPFLQAGVGYGWMKLDDEPGFVTDDSNINFVSMKVGAGLIYKITNNVEILGGVDWQKRYWQDVKYVFGSQSMTLEVDNTSISYYAGLNYLF